MSAVLAGAIVGGLLLVAAGAWLWRPGGPAHLQAIAARRRRSHATWLGLDDLDDRELELVIRMRYVDVWPADEARERILRRRALAEEIRRSRLRGHRAKNGRRRRPPIDRAG